MYVEVADTSGNLIHLPGRSELRPVRFGWAAIGGPSDAMLEATGRREGLATMLNWLGYRIKIVGESGLPVWWGMVAEVQLSLGAYSIGVSLEPMYNTVAVAYTYEDADNVTQRGTTEWAQAGSVATYGRKELLFSQSDLGSVQDAEDLAANLAARFGSPVPVVRSGGDGEDRATLYCRGWWHTVGWRYYKQLAGREAHEDGSGEQVLGVGVTSDLITFHEESKGVYLVGGQHGFRDGDKVVISGTTSNDGVMTIESATQADIWEYTATTIAFSPSNDIYDSALGLEGIEADDVILVRGALPANSGIKEVKKLVRSDTWTGHPGVYDHIETKQDGMLDQAAGDPITILRYGYFKTGEEPVNEGPSVLTTITAWGTKLAQSFALEHDTPDWPVHEVRLRLRKAGSPSDSVKVSLCADNSGEPGTVIESVTRLASTLATEYGWESFTFTGFNNLSYGVTYWLVIERTGAPEADNFYEFAVDESEGYGRGVFRLWDGSAWQARPTAASLLFQVVGKQDTGQQVRRILEEAAEKIVSVSTVTSGILRPIFRDGDGLASDEIVQLLNQGSDISPRMLLGISPERRATVYSKPNKPTDLYLLRPSGEVLDWHGRPLPAGTPLAGEWVRLDAPGLDNVLADSLTFFVEEAEYDVEAGEWSLTPENAPTPYDIGMQQG